MFTLPLIIIVTLYGCYRREAVADFVAVVAIVAVVAGYQVNKILVYLSEVDFFVLIPNK